MPARAATFPNVTAFNARPVGARHYRRAVVGGAVLGLGSVSAVAIMAGTAAVAAAWMVSGTLARNPAFRAGAPFALETAAMPRPPQRLADPADMFGSALAAADPAYATDKVREAALTPASANVTPLSVPVAAAAPPHAVKRQRSATLKRVPLPAPRPADRFDSALASAGPVHAPEAMHEAALTPAPAIAAPSTPVMLPTAPPPAPAQPRTAASVTVPLPTSRPADMPGSALASADPAYSPHVTHEAALTPAPAIAAPLSVPVAAAAAPPRAETHQRTAALTEVPVPGPRPADIAQIETRLEVAHTAAVARVSLAAAMVDEPPLSEPMPHQSQSMPRVAAIASKPTAPAVTGSIGSTKAAAHVSAELAAPAPAKAAAPRLAYNAPDLPARDSHTAIYDIVAHTVYLPDGERLEAHSGLGRMLDDPHYASAKARGPTPPNTYDLTLRSGLFHGVQALRLNPVADSKMYGRDGILAHTYMLGPTGQSFGCVSFKDYAAFLHAFQRGEVNRLVVVPHLAEPPSTVRASRDDGKRYAFDIESAH